MNLSSIYWESNKVLYDNARGDFLNGFGVTQEVKEKTVVEKLNSAYKFMLEKIYYIKSLYFAKEQDLKPQGRVRRQQRLENFKKATRPVLLSLQNTDKESYYKWKTQIYITYGDLATLPMPIMFYAYEDLFAAVRKYIALLRPLKESTTLINHNYVPKDKKGNPWLLYSCIQIECMLSRKYMATLNAENGTHPQVFRNMRDSVIKIATCLYEIEICSNVDPKKMVPLEWPQFSPAQRYAAMRNFEMINNPSKDLGKHASLSQKTGVNAPVEPARAVGRGIISHDHESLSPFCDDRSTLTTPDIFNQCHDAGWLKSWHDDRLDSSFVELTELGRTVLTLEGE